MRTHWKVTERVFPHHQLAAVIDLRRMSDYSQSYWLCDGLNDFPTMLLPLREGLLPSLILHWDLGLPMIGVEIRLLEMKCPPSLCLFSLWVDDKISYCWLWGRVCQTVNYPPPFCIGINCLVLFATTHQMKSALNNPLDHHVYWEVKRCVYLSLFLLISETNVWH